MRLLSTATASARLAATQRHFSSTNFNPVKRICLVGAGLMGAGIAQVAAQHGLKVTLVDMTEPALDNGREIIQRSIARIAKQTHPASEADQATLVASVFDNITTTTDPAEAVKDVDMVVEAIVENLNIKKDLFKLLDKNAREECIFASNTSGLGISDIASSTSAARRRRFGGLHFFNPVPQMKLVEVIRTEDTSDETMASLLDLCRRLGKTAVQCKDKPGFIVNRLLVPYMMEAVQMLERGDASAEDIDTAMKLGAGYPMGPIELTDFVGLDTAKYIVEGWRRKSGSDTGLDGQSVRVPRLIKDKVAEGRLGEGFFKYK